MANDPQNREATDSNGSRTGFYPTVPEIRNIATALGIGVISLVGWAAATPTLWMNWWFLLALALPSEIFAIGIVLFVAPLVSTWEPPAPGPTTRPFWRNVVFAVLVLAIVIAFSPAAYSFFRARNAVYSYLELRCYSNDKRSTEFNYIFATPVGVPHLARTTKVPLALIPAANSGSCVLSNDGKDDVLNVSLSFVGVTTAANAPDIVDWENGFNGTSNTINVPKVRGGKSVTLFFFNNSAIWNLWLGAIKKCSLALSETPSNREDCFLPSDMDAKYNLIEYPMGLRAISRPLENGLNE